MYVCMSIMDVGAFSISQCNGHAPICLQSDYVRVLSSHGLVYGASSRRLGLFF